MQNRILSHKKSKLSPIKPLTIQQISADIITEIFMNLSPETCARLGSICRKFYFAQINKFLWREKLKQHFPSILENLNLTNMNIDWRSQFIAIYNSFYLDLSKRQRNIFSLFKNNDITSLRNKAITPFELFLVDKNAETLIEWLQNNGSQYSLDFYYDIISNQFRTQQNIVDTQKTDDKNRTILYWAIATLQPYDHIAKLIVNGSKIDEIYSTGETDYKPLQIAIRVGNLSVVRGFVTNYPHLITTHLLVETLFDNESNRKHLPIIHYFLTLEVIRTHIDVVTDHDETALYIAAELGYSEIVTTLLKLGARLNPDSDGENPLHAAARQGQQSVVEILLNHDPTLLNLKDGQDMTLLMKAADGGHLATVNYLLKQKGIAINCQKSLSQIERVDLSSDYTALHFATEEHEAEIVLALLLAGASTRLPAGLDKALVIHLAAIKSECFEVFKILLQHDPELLNAKNAFNFTPLMIAVLRRNVELVQFLLAQPNIELNVKNSDPSLFNGDGYNKTALDLARAIKCPNIINLLITKGAKAAIELDSDHALRMQL